MGRLVKRLSLFVLLGYILSMTMLTVQADGNRTISREEAVEYALKLVEKKREDIEYREFLYNTQQEPGYELLVFSSGGYIIHMLDYYAVLEFSDGDVKVHPYMDVMDKKKYYLGPLCYLYEDNGQIFWLTPQRENIEIQLEDCRAKEQKIIEYAQSIGLPVARDQMGELAFDVRIIMRDMDRMVYEGTSQ